MKIIVGLDNGLLPFWQPNLIKTNGYENKQLDHVE